MNSALPLYDKQQSAWDDEADILPLPSSETRQVGAILREMNAVTDDQLHIALHEQKNSKEMLGAILLRLGFVQQDELAVALARRASIPSIDLTSVFLDPTLFESFSKETAARHLTLPLALDNGVLEIAMADPFDVVALDHVRRHFPQARRVRPYVASKASIEASIQSLGESFTGLDPLIRRLETGFAEGAQDSLDHPMIQLVDGILTDAVRQGASDIHFEPEDSFVRLRVRIDGTLRQVRALHLEHWPALSHRLKIMAGMNIADTRSIQDGRFQMQISGASVDFRVAIMPSVWGETIVVRILDHRTALRPLQDLGYSEAILQRLEAIALKPQGLVFVTGPTGSGKTTTLYSLLKKLSTPDVHIATLEEPVEFQLDLIRQTAIQEATGLNFAAAVRGVLRMDPDIILIGEVRDPDTAQMALRAAMTGHQVYSTLHCNEALGAIPRLIDLGLSPRILAGNLSGLIAQRLVRTLCPHCKKRVQATAAQARLLKLRDAPELFDATGCARCGGTGRKGRTVIAEVLPISIALDDLIAADAPRQALMDQARAEGFTTMQEDGRARALSGTITFDDLCVAVDMSRLPDTAAKDGAS